VVRDLRDLLGAKLVAYIGSVKETRAVRQWADGERKPSTEVMQRLRTAYHMAALLAERDSRAVVQAWFQGMNPHVPPARLLRGWEWATDGRFPGRWDDLHGNFRTIYAGSSLLEVLAHFRKDARLSVELDEIAEDDEDKVLHPTIAPGQVPKEWLHERAAASAGLSGRYCAVTASGSVAACIRTSSGWP
jgi:hypothetical protein